MSQAKAGRVRGGNLGWSMFMKVCKGAARERKLRNVFYFGGLYRCKLEALVEAVLRYLDAHDELEAVQGVFVSSDGGPGIRQLMELIPGAAFVLDRFHVAKKVQAAI